MTVNWNKSTRNTQSKISKNIKSTWMQKATVCTCANSKLSSNCTGKNENQCKNVFLRALFLCYLHVFMFWVTLPLVPTLLSIHWSFSGSNQFLYFSIRVSLWLKLLCLSFIFPFACQFHHSQTRVTRLNSFEFRQIQICIII